MIVMKFGGSSVATAHNIRKVKDIVQAQNEHYIVVVSALARTTDQLNQLAVSALNSDYQPILKKIETKHADLINELIAAQNQLTATRFLLQKIAELKTICTGIAALKELSNSTLARVLSFGERLSSFIICNYLQQEQTNIQHLDANQLITANGNYLSADINLSASSEHICKAVLTNQNYIVGGFIGNNAKGNNVVLGRGGSDLSAAVFANAINAARLEIWSDVNGMLNADPKIVKQADRLKNLSYHEAFELAYFGAKVLYPPTIRPVMEKSIPIYLKNTLNPEDEGTFISKKNNKDGDKIKGVTSLQEISIITVSGVGLAGKKGTARRIFQVIEEAEVNIILLMQGCSEQSICLGIKSINAATTAEALNGHFSYEIEKKLINPIEVENNHSIVAIVGDKMKNQVGLSGKVFAALGENGINVTAITQGASERNISIVVNKEDEAKAINVLHERFFQKAIKKVHLFIAGIGNVGNEFIKIIYKQQQHLYNSLQLDLIIVGIANSKKMHIDIEGIKQENIKTLNAFGTDLLNTADYIKKITELNLRNTVFIDNTASETVSSQYASLVKTSISVVTCNKIAGSSDFANYSYLKKMAKDKNCHFQYETSVGAALPIIKTINNLTLSGDKIYKIQAVLSGSLNYIFNNYNGTLSFSDIVLEAKNLGLTEPDPRIDLSGLDVKRKILILAREAGFQNELDEVIFENFLPENCSNSDEGNAFFEALSSSEQHFKNRYFQAQKAGKSLKVIANFDNGKMSISLQEIGPKSAFFNIGGKDNIVAIYTDRYADEPLIIKGAGAGAEVTASGVFSDLIYIVNK